MTLSDDLYEIARRVRYAETRGEVTLGREVPALRRAAVGLDEAPILRWQGDFAWHEPVARTRAGRPARPARVRAGTRELTGDWRRWLVAGISWMVVALVVLQIDAASILTVVGVMFSFAAVQTLVMPAVRLVSATFGVLFVVAEILCFFAPIDTVAAAADMLGCLFAVVGLWWMVEALLERRLNPLWWIGLAAGVLMSAVAVSTVGRLYTPEADSLLVCAGLWGLMQGITLIARAFAVRRAPDRA
ncbi:hypothetical protein OM076_20375 [Solirubrobacter ginsenosidimutans]|uniref:DUF308 domain-containing protein n=1 Tax=Solirubrobacter ginsenosidimutans TaxID=490573 RepID=A0A9X3MVP2_9ACTN|nr:hypothetical protein [Solirubrobacter ginsenosidimutans]MDA0162641.1 hypothetical protein [Solirubrobacter ginsenosidimutans]